MLSLFYKRYVKFPQHHESQSYEFYVGCHKEILNKVICVIINKRTFSFFFQISQITNLQPLLLTFVTQCATILYVLSLPKMSKYPLQCLNFKINFAVFVAYQT